VKKSSTKKGTNGAQSKGKKVKKRENTFRLATQEKGPKKEKFLRFNLMGGEEVMWLVGRGGRKRFEKRVLEDRDRVLTNTSPVAARGRGGGSRKIRARSDQGEEFRKQF